MVLGQLDIYAHTQKISLNLSHHTQKLAQNKQIKCKKARTKLILKLLEYNIVKSFCDLRLAKSS